MTLRAPGTEHDGWTRDLPGHGWADPDPVASDPWAPGRPAPPAPPAPPVPPGPRRRAARRRGRRWPWVLATITGLVAICCGGFGGIAWTYLGQFPASVTLPDHVAGLNRQNDRATQIAMRVIEVRVRAHQLLAEQVFAGRYQDPAAAGAGVTVFGATELIFNPRSTLDSGFGTVAGDYHLTGVVDEPAGALGGVERCGTGESSGTPVSVCGWADHGSVAIGVFANRSIDASAALLRSVRAGVLHRSGPAAN